MPLPFVLGPLIATAGLGLTGWPVVGARRLRPGAQFVIGSAIGDPIHPRAVVLKLVMLLPLIIGAALMSMVVCAAASAFLIVAAGLDRKTAFFATAPAGASEMANNIAGVALWRRARAHHGGADDAGGAHRPGGALPGDPFRQ